MMQNLWLKAILISSARHNVLMRLWNKYVKRYTEKICVASKWIIKRTNKKENETNWKPEAWLRKIGLTLVINPASQSGCAFIVRINEDVVNIKASNGRALDRLLTRMTYAIREIMSCNSELFSRTLTQILERHVFSPLVIFAVSYESPRFLMHGCVKVASWKCAIYFMHFFFWTLKSKNIK